MIRIPYHLINASEKNTDFKRKLESNLRDIKNIIKKFQAELKKISYKEKWKMPTFFSPLEVVTLAYGFDPDYFYWNSKDYKISFSKTAIKHISDEYRKSKFLLLPKGKTENLFQELEEYDDKINEMTFVYNMLIDEMFCANVPYIGVAKIRKDCHYVKLSIKTAIDFITSKNIHSTFFVSSKNKSQEEFLKT